MTSNTLIFQHRNPLQALTGLSRQMALPHEFTPERFPSFPALERTAVMGFNSPVSVALPANTATKAMVCRQAAFPVWADQPWTTEAYSVTWKTNLTPLGMSSTWEVNSTAAGARVGAVGRPALVGCTQPKVPFAVLGVDSGTGPCPWFWVPGNTSYFTVAASSTVPPAGNVGKITMEQWTGPGEQNQTNTLTATFNGTNYSTPAGNTTSTGYWIRPADVSFSAAVPFSDLFITVVTSAATPSFVGSAANAGTLTFSAGTAVVFSPIVSPSEYTNSRIPWTSTRVTAAAALFTNVSQVLNKGGTVLCGRLAPQTDNPFVALESTIQVLHPAEKAYLALEMGAYTYCPPSTDMQDFWDYTVPNTAGVINPVYRLDNSSLVNILFFTAGSVAETIAVNADWHFEFRTTSALFQIGMSGLTLETLHQAQLSLAAVGFFFNNESHLQILKSIVPRIIGFAKKYLPAISMAPGIVGTVGKAAMAAGDVFLSSRPRKALPPTSGKNSGITGGKAKPSSKKGKKVSVGGKKKKSGH